MGPALQSRDGTREEDGGRIKTPGNPQHPWPVDLQRNEFPRAVCMNLEQQCAGLMWAGMSRRGKGAWKVSPLPSFSIQ